MLQFRRDLMRLWKKKKKSFVLFCLFLFFIYQTNVLILHRNREEKASLRSFTFFKQLTVCVTECEWLRACFTFQSAAQKRRVPASSAWMNSLYPLVLALKRFSEIERSFAVSLIIAIDILKWVAFHGVFTKEGSFKRGTRSSQFSSKELSFNDIRFLELLSSWMLSALWSNITCFLRGIFLSPCRI